jgi:hypothetical protein
MKKVHGESKLTLNKQVVAILKGDATNMGLLGKTIIATSRGLCNPTFGCQPPTVGSDCPISVAE